MKKLLPFFSYILHPIFIPLYGTLAYLIFGDLYFTMAQNFLLLFQVVIITVFLPMAFFYLLKTFGKVDTVMLSDVNQRKIPLLLQISLTAVLVKQSITVDLFPELFYFFLAGIGTTVMAFILLFVRLKASIHMMGMAALTFFVMGLPLHHQINLMYSVAFLFLLCGLTASSRLYMKAHTLKELIIGFALGMLPQLVCFWYWV